MTTKLFLDTEFTGLHQHTTLISIGLIAETGNYFYGECTDYDPSQLNPWLKENVMAHLSGNLPPAASTTVEKDVLVQGTKTEIAAALRTWLAQFGDHNSVEIWADVLAWDWVLFCELFGGSLQLPAQVHYIPRDLSTYLLLHHYDPDVQREQLGTVDRVVSGLNLVKHHALYDAMLEYSVYENVESELPY